MSPIADTTFKITNTKLYVPIVTLSSKDNVKPVKILKEGFKRLGCWNEYQTKIETRDLDNTNLTRFSLDASFQGVRRLFVLAFDNSDIGAKKVERNSRTKHFLPRVNLSNYNVLIDGKNFCDESINDQIKRYDEISKSATWQRDGYSTGCLLDYQYFKDHYQLTAVDPSKQKELEANSRAVHQIEFYEMLQTNSQICALLEKSRGIAKVL